jgi:hypothetical protein
MKYGSIPVENYLSDYLVKETDFEGTNKQQFIMEPKAINVNLLESYRIEQLFFENDFKLGLTYFPSLYVLFNNEAIGDNIFFQSTYDELFLNTQYTEFENDYLYVGIDYMMNNMAGYETGYKTHIMPNHYIDPIYTVAFINF